ncbi:MAG: hypothetical protein WC969_07420 [Elusimicrobiota bacterium]|jgi:hypothetical protein
MAGKKKAAAPSSKRAKQPEKKSAATNADPEWDHLEERFSTLSTDFNQLAEMMDRDKEEEPER